MLDGWKTLQERFPLWDEGGRYNQKPLWEAMSGQYAEGASGTVIYVHPDGYYGDVWKNIERPILEFKGVHIIEVVL